MALAGVGAIRILNIQFCQKLVNGLPNKDGDLEYVYKVVQIAIPLRNKGGNDVEIYVVPFESRDEAEDDLYKLRQTFLSDPT